MGLERFTGTGRLDRDDLPDPVARALADQPDDTHDVAGVDTGACEFCAAPTGPRHRHVVDLEQRSLQCACRACALLFTREGAAGGQHRTIPERHRELERVEFSRRRWARLRIPVDLVFVLHDSTAGRPVAFYPSPAGATESELPLDEWRAIVAANPAMGELQPDVEAVIIRVPDDADPEAFVVPIDRCYELVGRLRTNWRGFGGGSEVRAAIDDFFADVRRRARGSTVGTPS